MKNAKLFPLFFNKLDVLDTLNDNQMCEVIHAIVSYTKDQDVELTDNHARAVYQMLIFDFESYNDNREEQRARQKQYRERREMQKAEKKPVEVPAVPAEPAKAEKPEKVDNLSEDAKEIIGYFNLICSTHYKAATPKTKQLIKTRMREGFCVDDFKAVIAKMHRKWTGTEWEKFLRPETLFGTKFESYLNQTDRTDAELKTERETKEKYESLFEFANESEVEDEQTGVYEYNRSNIECLPDFTS